MEALLFGAQASATAGVTSGLIGTGGLFKMGTMLSSIGTLSSVMGAIGSAISRRHVRAPGAART